LLDWLHRHGEAAGFVPDEVDPRTDFLEFVFRQGHRFEAAVLTHIETLAPVTRIVPEQENASEDIRSLEYAERTFEAMRNGEAIIAQGPLRNPDNRTYGAPDLLVRSDVLEKLFPGTLTPEEVMVAAPDLGHRYHYRVVDIKFSSLGLDASWHLAT